MGLWPVVPSTTTLVGHAIAVAGALAVLDLILAGVGLLPTFWARRRV